MDKLYEKDGMKQRKIRIRNGGGGTDLTMPGRTGNPKDPFQRKKFAKINF